MLEKHTKSAYLQSIVVTDQNTTAVDCAQLGVVLSSMPTWFGCSIPYKVLRDNPYRNAGGMLEG